MSKLFNHSRATAVLGLAALFTAGPVFAETVTIDFDAPEYSAGVSVGKVGDVNILPAGTVFVPNVATFTGTQALRSALSCTSPGCTNNAYLMQFRFGDSLPYTNNGWLYRPASRVSFRVGASSVAQSCFPEGTSCAMYASVSAYDSNGTPVVAQQDVFLFDAGTGYSAPITRDITLVDAQARIARVALTFGKGTLAHDIGFPGEPQIDHLEVEFPDTPPPTGPLPAAPTIQITEPSGSRAAPFNVHLRGSVNAPGGVAAFCYRLNQPLPSGPGCTGLSLLQPNKSFDITIPDHELAAGANTFSVRVYDLSGQVATQTATVTTLAPLPPVVTVTTPGASQWVNPSQTNNVAGLVRTVGTLKGFCLRVDSPAAPAPATCTQQLGAVNMTNPAYQPMFYSTPLTSGAISSGQHTISLFAVDRWNQVGRADVLVNAPTDLRVVAMEITQGIQTFALPTNISGSTPYTGVNLRQGVPTVVRVFANTPFSGYYTGATMLLNGFKPDPQYGESPLGAILPDSSPAGLNTGTMSIPTSERYYGRGVFTFTLPNAWTLTPGLRLEAKLSVPFGLQECGTCVSNNQFSVTNINFGPAIALTISPVSLTFTDAMGVVNAPPAPAGLFAPAANISPVPAASFVVRPYVGTVDVSGQVGAGGACRAMNSTCEDVVHQMVAAFNLSSPQPGVTIGVGPVDVGLDIPMFVRRPPFGQFEFGHLAIADSRSLMTAVAHEFYHSMGFFHASPCNGADLFNMWPPDQKGYIQGVGLDRTPRPDSTGVWNGHYIVKVPDSGPLIGGRDEWFDLMSYCANDFSAWISVHNWDSFGGPLPNGLIPDSLLLGQSTATINTDGSASAQQGLEAEGGVMYASVVLDGENRAVSMRVRRAGTWYYQDPVKSEYDFVVRDAKRYEIARLPATVTLRQNGEKSENSGVVATAYLPVKEAASIELQFHGEPVANVQRSRAAPKLEVARLDTDVLTRDESLELRWKAGDADDDALEARIDFSPGTDQPFRAVYLGPNHGRWTVPGRLLSTTKEGRVRVVISDGFNEVEQEIGPFIVRASAPLLEIQGVPDGASFPQSTPLRFQAAAFGDGLMPLSPKNIRWSLDGKELGAGAEIEVRNLEAGRHFVQAVAREGKLESAREVMFEVRPNDLSL
jgi:hypothetical protein